MPLTQESRVCRLETPLGKDALLVEQFSANESISRLFQIDLELVSPQGGIDFKQIVGKSVLISVDLEGGDKRRFHGLVSRFAQGGIVQGEGSKGEAVRLVTYRAQVVPWLWFLTRNADCRIFQDKSVPDILMQVFKDLGFTDFKFELHGTHGPRNYCVQYRETDFNFVSRLMEEEGIAYWFEHHADKHVMVLTDAPSGFAKCDGMPIAEYSTTSGASSQAGEVEDWSVEREFHPGKFAITDYNFETPSTSLLSSTATTDAIGGNSRFEIFDYATEHQNSSEGNRKVKLRMEIEETGAVRSSGSSTCAPFCAGQRFTLKGHYDKEFNKEYLLTGVQHSVSQGVGRAGGGEGGSYANGFSCIPYSIPFRPPLVTPKPCVPGCQPAIVCGPAGEEIYVDKYGRVKVQFYWDREGKRDEHSSCWIRVSHPSAGKGWGSVTSPRIDQEVIVDFVEGDPDRPIIVGRVYNAEQMPPYALPGSMTQSGMKSRSSKGGGGYNEIRLEDSKNSEEIVIHAQKNMGTTVEHDQTNTVHNTFTETIKSDATIKITEGKYKHDVVAGIADYHVQGELTEKYDTSQKTTVKGQITIESTAGEILIEAANKITLHTGDSKIMMDKAGNISVTGKKITIIGENQIKASSEKTDITGSQEAKFGTGGQNIITNPSKTQISGAAINASAVGMHEIAGALVKIN